MRESKKDVGVGNGGYVSTPIARDLQVRPSGERLIVTVEAYAIRPTHTKIDEFNSSDRAVHTIVPSQPGA